MGPTDLDLLRQYADGSQEAFAELVRRHLGLVFSAARRQTPSPQTAEEVTQSVFISLAQGAHKLKSGTSLAGWLHLTTRHTAINAARAESRRRAREGIALELSAMNSPSSAWPHVEPLLDEAVAALPDADRTAILLRYFESKSLREIGESLGTSDEAAQKRVSRAVDQLRAFFVKRGIAISAAGLVTDLSAHAVATAPAALGSAVSHAAAVATLSSTALSSGTTTSSLVAMTTLQKSLLTAALVVAFGAGIYETRALARTEASLRTLEGTLASSTAQTAVLRAETDTTLKNLAVLRARAAQPTAPAEPTALDSDTAQIAELIGRVQRMKDHFRNNPARTIPEMALVKDEDWLQVARERPLDTEANLRASLSRLRLLGRGAFTEQLLRGTNGGVGAIRAFAEAHDGQMPPAMSELAPLLPAIEPAALAAMLERYAVVWTGRLMDAAPRIPLIVEKEDLVVDKDYDSQVTLARAQSFSAGNVPNPNSLALTAQLTMGPLTPVVRSNNLSTLNVTTGNLPWEAPPQRPGVPPAAK